MSFIVFIVTPSSLKRFFATLKKLSDSHVFSYIDIGGFVLTNALIFLSQVLTKMTLMRQDLATR